MVNPNINTSIEQLNNESIDTEQIVFPEEWKKPASSTERALGNRVVHAVISQESTPGATGDVPVNHLAATQSTEGGRYNNGIVPLGDSRFNRGKVPLSKTEQ